MARRKAEEPVSPHSLDAERSVLGVLLIDPPALDRVTLRASDFFRAAHATIYRTMRELQARGSAVDFVTLRNALTAAGTIEDIGGPAYLASLADGIPKATNLEHYCAIVTEKACLRAIIALASASVTAAYQDEPSAEILERLDRGCVDLHHGTGRDTPMPLTDSLKGLWRELEHRTEHKGEVHGLATGLSTLDQLTLGWQPGDLVVIAARPSVGKTTLALNLARHAAQTGARVAVISLEMRRRQLERRLLSSLSGVSLSRIMSGYLAGSDFENISQAFQALGDLPLVIHDRSSVTVWDIRSACRRAQVEGGLGLVVIDYIQLITGALDRKGATRNEELTDVSRRLKIMADDLGVPIIVLSQLRRLHGAKPTLDDLRDCGAIEQDADVVGLLHRRNPREPGRTELIVAKQRNGATGSIHLDLDPETVTFTESVTPPAPESTPPPPSRRRARAYTGGDD
jgi:replicative DNA helicase